MNIDFDEYKKTVLIVEDSKPDEMLISQRVRSKWSDVDILTSSSLAKALRIIKTNNPDMVLLDLNLDDSMGPETVTGVRKYNPSIPIVVLTGLATDITVSECLKSGANHVCIKTQLQDDDFFNVLEQHAA